MSENTASYVTNPFSDTPLTVFLGRQFDRIKGYSRRLAFWRARPQEAGYVFHIDADEVGFRLYDRLFQAYLSRFPHRFSSGRVEDVPELVLALKHLPRTELENLTLYVIGQLNQERERFDFQFYTLVSDLLAQLLTHRPWGNEDGLRRIGEALFFTSPHGFEGVIYWPLVAYLRAVRASFGGRKPDGQVRQILELMEDELRGYFAFGYHHEVAEARELLAEI